jgi:hypothetical protein
MGLFLQKLEKSLRLSTRAHIVDLPLDTGAGGFCAVHPLRDQETYVAGGCGLSLEQQLLVDVLKQLYKIREEREKDEHQRRSRAAGPSHDRHVVEFLDEFVKYGPLSDVRVVCLIEFAVRRVVAVCQAVLSQRAGEAPSATAAANRKRKLDSASNDEEEMKWEQERKEQREEVEEEEDNEEEEDVQIRDLLAHLRKRAKVVVGVKVCCEHREKGGLQTRSERSLGCCGGPAAVEVGVPGRSQEGLCVVTLVQQVVTTMTAAANHGRNKRGWISSAALDNGMRTHARHARHA